MTDESSSAFKVHYICQTYIEKKTGSAGQVALVVDKQFQYTSADQARSRAERESRLDTCAGADAYSVTEDEGSGEVSEPTFLLRLGNVPEFDAF